MGTILILARNLAQIRVTEIINALETFINGVNVAFGVFRQIFLFFSLFVLVTAIAGGTDRFGGLVAFSSAPINHRVFHEGFQYR